MSEESLSVDPSVLADLSRAAALRSWSVRGLAQQESLAPIAVALPSSAMSGSAESAAMTVSSVLGSLADRIDLLGSDARTSADAYTGADNDTSDIISRIPSP